MTAMERVFFVALLVVTIGLPLQAQDQSVGIAAGTSSALSSGFSLSLDHMVSEVSYSTTIDLGAEIRIRLGQVKTDDETFTEAFETLDDVTIEYADLLVEYRFYEPFGSSTLFLGPGAYKRSVDGEEESAFGYSAGVAALFPVTRRTGVTAEAAYHWADFDKDFDFVNFNVGLRFAF